VSNRRHEKVLCIPSRDCGRRSRTGHSGEGRGGKLTKQEKKEPKHEEKKELKRERKEAAQQGETASPSPSATP